MGRTGPFSCLLFLGFVVIRIVNAFHDDFSVVDIVSQGGFYRHLLSLAKQLGGIYADLIFPLVPLFTTGFDASLEMRPFY